MNVYSFYFPQYHAPKSQSNDSSVSTCHVCRKKNQKLVKKTTGVWKKLALEHMLQAHFSEKARLDDSHFVVGLVKKELKKFPKKATLYVAQDDHKNVQGIAIATISKGCNWLEFLVTNPQNIPVHPYEVPLRGVGTKLVAHVVNDILQGKKHRCKKLHLWARPTSVGFYQKLGFETPLQAHDRETTYMVLRSNAMKALVAKASICKER